MVVGATSAKGWALFKEQVDDTIIKAVQPKIVYPLLSKTYPAASGVQEFNTTDSYLDPEDVGESGEYPSVNMSFSRTKVNMSDIGVAPRLPINWIKDSRWDLVNDHVEAIGFGVARKLNTDCLSTLKVSIDAAAASFGVTYTDIISTNSITASYTWGHASADVMKDVSLALGMIEALDFQDGKKYLVLHPSIFKYLRIDANLLKYINYGDASLIQKGIYPTPFGVDILTTSAASTTVGYIENYDYASFKYYEREPLTTEMEKAARSKNLEIVASIRYAFAMGRPKANVRLNTIGA